MSQRASRLQRIAVGSAASALAIAVIAVIVVARRSPEPGDPVPRRVAASALARLSASTTEPSRTGVVVTDAALARALGLAPGDAIVAISGRAVTRPEEVEAVVRDLAALRPARWFVELVRDRDRGRALARWELDGDLAAALAGDAGDAGASGAIDPLRATIRRRGATHFELPRATAEAWAADPARLTAGVTAVSRPRDEGLQLIAIERGAVLAALGLEAGDVIRALDGAELTAGALAALPAHLGSLARTATQVTLDVQRRGQVILFNYLIR